MTVVWTCEPWHRKPFASSLATRWQQRVSTCAFLGEVDGTKATSSGGDDTWNRSVAVLAFTHLEKRSDVYRLPNYGTKCVTATQKWEDWR
jgi:hypothetical protein